MLRGISKDCGFECKNIDCRQSYVDELIRDMMIKETPHTDVRRQCLMESNIYLKNVLAKAVTYVKTLETVKV